VVDEARGAVEPEPDEGTNGGEAGGMDTAGRVPKGGDGRAEAANLAAPRGPGPGHHHGHGHGAAGHTFQPAHLLAWEEERLTRLGGRERVAEMLALVPRDGLVVDVGAGVGSFALALAEGLPQGRVMAIDHQADMVATLTRRARERGLTQVEAVEGRAEQLPLAAATADLVLFSMVLHDMSDPKAVLAEAHRVLRPGGVLYVLEFMPGKTDMGPPAERLFEPERLRWLCAAAAFTEVEIRQSPGPLYCAVGRAADRPVGPR